MARPSPSPLSRRERERAFRTRLVLEAAETVFAEHGFQGASVDTIAARAEVAVGTLYNLFGSKEGVFAALAALRSEDLLSEVRRALSRARTARAQLSALVEAVFRYFDAHRDTFRLYLNVTHGFPWHIRASMGERSFARYQEVVRLVAAVLARTPLGRRRPGRDRRRLAAAFMGALNGLLTDRYMGADGTPIETDVALATRALLALVGYSGRSLVARSRTDGVARSRSR